MPDKTTLQETSQALFCSVADKLGSAAANRILDSEKYKSYEEFLEKKSRLIEDSFKRVEAPNVSLKHIEDFLAKGKIGQEWYISSKAIALALLKELSKISPKFGEAAPKFQELYYFRGDPDIMGNISKLFGIANKNTKWFKLTNQVRFGNINKWNPADIYLGSKKAKKEIKDELDDEKENYLFEDLNKLIDNLIISGDLLPLSLKKAGTTVKIVRVNFSPGDKKELLESVEFVEFKQGKNIPRDKEWKKYKIVTWKGTSTKKTVTRDYTITIKAKDRGNLNLRIRHDPSTPKFSIEVDGKDAKQGSIGSFAIFSKILGLIDSKFETKILGKYSEAEATFSDEMNEREYRKGLKNHVSNTAAKDKKNEFNHKRGEVSGIFFLNILMPPLTKWLLGLTQENKNKLAMRFFKYCTSRSKQSGKFVIAK